MKLYRTFFEEPCDDAGIPGIQLITAKGVPPLSMGGFGCLGFPYNFH